MSTKTRATIKDLYEVEGKAELVNGEIVKMPPAGDEPNVAGGLYFCALIRACPTYRARAGLYGWRRISHQPAASRVIHP